MGKGKGKGKGKGDRLDEANPLAALVVLLHFLLVEIATQSPFTAVWGVVYKLSACASLRDRPRTRGDDAYQNARHERGSGRLFALVWYGHRR